MAIAAATYSYRLRREQIQRQQKEIAKLLKKLDDEQKKEPLSYAYAGSVSFVVEQLDKVIEGLGGETIAK